MSLNDELRLKPMDFMRRYAISPPAGAGYRVVPNPDLTAATANIMVPNQSLTAKESIWSDADGSALPSGTTSVGYLKVVKGGVVWVEVMDVPRDKPGAKTFGISPTEMPGRTPIHFLPWDGMGTLVEMYIPQIGRNLDDPDNPNIFFTTALSGCSVFVDGDPTGPRIVHAGIDGKLKVNSADFWRKRLVDLGRKKNVPVPLEGHILHVNKDQYGDDSSWIRGYKMWLESSKSETMTIKSVAGWACVFGIRFGRLWSFYLQRNSTVSLTTLVKKSAVSKGGTAGPTLKGSGAPVDVTTTGKGFFGGKTLYSTTSDFARPVVIESFYPKGKAVIKIKEEYSGI